MPLDILFCVQTVALPFQQERWRVSPDLGGDSVDSLTN